MKRRYNGQAMTRVARELRQEQTPAEVRIWSLVRNGGCGHRFLRQALAGQYVMDFYCPSVRLVIEVDGSIHDQITVQERDKNRQAVLEGALKMTVLRFTNAEVLTGTDEELRARITNGIALALANAPPPAERSARRQ